MNDQSGVRYSQGQKDLGDARNFAWEFPVPDTDFWRDLPYCASRNFLMSFTPERAQQLSTAHLDTKANIDAAAKMELLIHLLYSELEEQDAVAARAEKSTTLFDTDYTRWKTIWTAIATLQMEIDRKAEAIIVTRMLHQTRRDPANLIHLHLLAGLMLQVNDFAQAERMAVQVKAWLDGRLGKDAPQALNMGRILAESIWRQNSASRRQEAEGILAGIRTTIDGMEGGQYAVYKDGEIKMTDELMARLLAESDN